MAAPSAHRVWQTPNQTFSGSIDCIALRDVRRYFDVVDSYDSTHVLYMAKDDADVQGYTYSYMEGGLPGKEYVMYEIPADRDRVIINPNVDNAGFVYMNTEYSFGEITDDTRGELKLASVNGNGISIEASFRVFEVDTEFGKTNFDLPSNLKEIEESAFEGTKATVIYIPDSCTSIGAYAFKDSAVEQIRIPAGCSIADTAFEGCASVEIFGLPDSAAEVFCNTHDNCSFVTE